MGRNKLKIQRLESASGRQVTYSKRRTGITKKVKELSILCDIDALLLLFSTTGKPTLCLGEKTKFEEIIKRYAQICPQERMKKKLESLEALKKTFKNTDHVIDIEQLMHHSDEKPAEELKKQIKMCQEQIQETLIWLGPLGDLDELENLESIDKVIAMEKTLNQLVNDTKIQKENFENMLMNHFHTAQGVKQGLALNGELGLPSQFSNIHGPGPLTLLPQFTMFSQMHPGLGRNNSYITNFDFPTGSVQLNGGTGEGNAWFYMGEPPQPILLEHPFSFPQMDLASTSNQGSSYSEETEGMSKQAFPLQYVQTGPSSSSQQITMEQNLGESSLNGNNAFSDNLLGQNNNPFIFDHNFFGYMDFDSWAAVDQMEIKPSVYNHVNRQTNRDLV